MNKEKSHEFALGLAGKLQEYLKEEGVAKDVVNHTNEFVNALLGVVPLVFLKEYVNDDYELVDLHKLLHQLNVEYLQSNG